MLELLQIGQYGFTIVGVVYVLYRIISSTSTRSTAEEYPPVQPPRRPPPPPPPPPPSHLTLTFTGSADATHAAELALQAVRASTICDPPPHEIERPLAIIAARAIERGMPQRRVKALIKALRHGGRKG